jgi:diguanylate cyclase (GGDEF)-like protein
MFENLSNGVAVFQPSPSGQDFILTTFNNAGEKIDGVHREDLIGKNVVEAFPGIFKFGLLDVFRRVWESGHSEHFPISNYQEGQISGWRENYVYKLSSGELVLIYSDVTKEKQIEEKLHQLAHFDALTALPNRTLFNDRLQQSLATAKRDKTFLALMFLDLDKFKPVNDNYGHDVGDLLLKEVAKRLRDCVRESDTVSRIGGDEFVILFPVIEATQDAIVVAEKILYALNQPFELADHRISISGSIGIAVYPEHGSDEKLLSKNADIAMYYAKNAGRNNAMIYRSEMENSL